MKGKHFNLTMVAELSSFVFLLAAIANVRCALIGMKHVLALQFSWDVTLAVSIN